MTTAAPEEDSGAAGVVVRPGRLAVAPGARRALSLIPLLLLAVLLAACTSDSRRALAVPVEAGGTDPALFVAAGDVEIHLEEARLQVADLRLEQPSEVARRSLAFIRTARAHPGHDHGGDVVGELLGAWELDLLAGPSSLGEATCLEGELATGRLLVSGEPAAVLAGSASLPTGEERAFRFEMSLDQEISSITLSGTLDADAPPAGITLGISPAAMLSYADWNTDDGDGLLTLVDGLLGNTVPFGVANSTSFTFSLDD